MIDEKKLIKDLMRTPHLGYYDEDIKAYIDCVSLYTITNIIKNQPTTQPQGIDKDRLIEFLKKEHEYWEGMNQRSVIGADCGSDAIGIVLGWVNQQPTSDGWIPVSERLPEKEDLSDDGFVLVQEGQGAMFKGRYDVDMSTWYDDVGLTFYNGVIAWQPLPQPYKESE